MSCVMNTVRPHIFDRVHSAYFGYGTVIGVEAIEEADHGEYNAVVLFDDRNEILHSADSYEETCYASFHVEDSVRNQRCYWVDVYAASTNPKSCDGDKVRLIPFGTLEYRQHPIRAEFKRGVDKEPVPISIVAIDHNEDMWLIAFDEEYPKEAIPRHNGKGLTTYYDDILEHLWPDKEIYYWANEGRISINAFVLGTVPAFDEDANTDTYVDEDEALEDEDAWEGPVRDEDDEDTVASPSYYKIARVEPNELMADLMSFEQHEGFLWGNIIKYAYRYGNKGEKAETVKKIRKYCDMLLEILEPKSELED